jgi:hypothetical protein
LVAFWVEIVLNTKFYIKVLKLNRKKQSGPSNKDTVEAMHLAAHRQRIWARPGGAWMRRVVAARGGGVLAARDGLGRR